MKNWKNLEKLSPRKEGEDDNLSINKTTRGRIPNLPFEYLKNKVLGKNYNLSLVFIGDKLSRKYNKEYLNKDKSTNILSFPYSSSSGEIFLNLAQTKREHSSFGFNIKKFQAFLFIHGLLHLKGLTHGSRMEKAETKILKNING